MHPARHRPPTHPRLQQAREDGLSLLYSGMPISLILMLFLGVATAFALALEGQSRAWLWPLVSAGLSVSVHALLSLRFRLRRSGEAHGSWQAISALSLGFQGLAWSALAWLPLGLTPPTQMLLALGIASCLALINAFPLFGCAPAYTAFMAALFLPLALRIALLYSAGAWLILVGSAVLGALLAWAFTRQHHRLLQAFAHHRLTQDLLRQQRVIFESAGEGILLLRPAPHYTVKSNPRFAQMLGYEPGELKGMPPWEWLPETEDWHQLDEAARTAIGTERRPFHGEMELKRKDGSRFWAEVSGRLVALEAPELGTVWVVSDITERRRNQEELARSQQRLRDLIALSSDLYWEQDAQFRYTTLEGAQDLLDHLGTSRFLGKADWEIRGLRGIAEAAWDKHRQRLERHEPFRDFIYQMKGMDGSFRWLCSSGNPVLDGDGHFQGYHGTVSDITTRVQTEAKYRHQAYHDTLTGLPNRRLLADRLDQAIFTARRKEHKVALLLLDLDRFKQVNDRYGHAAGDRVLETLAQRLRNAVRGMDTVARLGGDEFVILLPEIRELGEAETVAEKILQITDMPVLHDQHQYQVGASIGISLYPDHGENSETLLNRADFAMYASKQRGGQQTRAFHEDGDSEGPEGVPEENQNGH